MKRVLVVTKNEYLGQKIKLALLSECEVFISDKANSSFDLCFWDIDSVEQEIFSERIFSMSSKTHADLPLPFSFDELKKRLSPKKDSPQLMLKGKLCVLRGREIKLTDLEASLLALLISAKGEFVSREEILQRVWKNEADSGIINVYIHYLREKLEKGEKIIISSRKGGYRIENKFLREGSDA